MQCDSNRGSVPLADVVKDETDRCGGMDPPRSDAERVKDAVCAAFVAGTLPGMQPDAIASADDGDPPEVRDARRSVRALKAALEVVDLDVQYILDADIAAYQAAAERGEAPKAGPSCAVTQEGEEVVLTVSEGSDGRYATIRMPRGYALGLARELTSWLR